MKVMLIPGNGDADMASDIWYPWAVVELKKFGLNLVAENMPDPDIARKKYWLPFIEEKLEGDEDAILIGHSSGGLAALRYAENHKVKGLIIIGVSHTDLGEEKEKQSGYFDEDWKWEKIKENTDWIVQLHSINDPFIPVEEARYIASKLGSEYCESQDGGHFVESEFPELVDVLKSKGIL